MKKNILKVLSTTSLLAVVIGISSCASNGLVGPQGQQGDIGPQGIQGSSGLAGSPGLQGPAGPMGPAGETGATGPRGPSGSTGQRGADGAPGSTSESVVLNPIDLGPTTAQRSSYVQNKIINEGYIGIETIADWIDFALNDDTDFYQGKFVLKSDIDFADLTLLNDGNSTPFSVYDLIVGRRSESPTKPFKGTFDGANFSISNFQIIDDTTADFGLFHRITGDVEFRNFSLVNFNIETEGKIGAISSREYDTSPLTSLLVSNVTLKDSYLRSGNVASDNSIISDEVGGLFAELDLNYDYDNSIYSPGFALFENINISNSFIFSANDSVGGIVGQFKGDNITVLNSKNSSEIASLNDEAGGLLGYLQANSATIKNSSNSGPIASFEGKNVGGLVGELWVSDFLNLATSFNSGTISGESNIGGLIGELYINGSNINYYQFSARAALVDISNSYNIGNLVANYAEEFYEGVAGGLIGLVDFGQSTRALDLTISNSYSSSDIKTITSGGGLIGSALYTGLSKYTFNNVFTLNNFENVPEFDLGYKPLIGSFIYYNNEEGMLDVYEAKYRDVVVTKDAFHLNKYTNAGIETRLDLQYGSQFVPNLNFFKENSFIFNNVWAVNSTWVFNNSINNGLPTLKNNIHLNSSSTFEVEPSFTFSYEIIEEGTPTLIINFESDIQNYYVFIIVTQKETTPDTGSGEVDIFTETSRFLRFKDSMDSSIEVVFSNSDINYISLFIQYYDFSGNSSIVNEVALDNIYPS